MGYHLLRIQALIISFQMRLFRLLQAVHPGLLR